MADQPPAPVSKFDRAIGALVGLPDTIRSSPTTVRALSPLVGSAQTFIVQTFRQREKGDTLFVEYMDDSDKIRLVIPPEVTKVIARQRDSLSGRNRKTAAKAAAAERKAHGFKPNTSGLLKHKRQRRAAAARSESEVR